MAAANKAKKNYRKMLEWYQYRAKENTRSLEKLTTLLSELDRGIEAGEVFDKDLDDLESLKFIYETGIRKFESQVDFYQKLIDG